MDFEFASRYAEDRDFVLVGYRGVDGLIVQRPGVGAEVTVGRVNLQFIPAGG